MAIFHMSVKAVSRSAGRSATGSAAYRAGEKITDKRTGEIHDYTRKGGVEDSELVLPDGSTWTPDRGELWNAAELAEKRKDACVAREYEVALPSELSPAERTRLAVDFAKDMANREGCAVDVAIHAPGRGGDSRNHHAHILRTTRKVEGEGLGAKLDTEKAGRNRKQDLAVVRERWAELVNERLQENGIEARIDHRSNAERGIEAEPTKHLGPTATAFERRTGQPSDKRLEHEQAITDRLTTAKALGEAERAIADADASILDLSTSLAAALSFRDQAQRQAEETRRQAEQEKADQAAKEKEARQAEPIETVQARLQATVARMRQLDIVLKHPPPPEPNQEIVELQAIDKYVSNWRGEQIKELGFGPEKRGLFGLAAKAHAKKRADIEKRAVELEKEMKGDGPVAREWRGKTWKRAEDAYGKEYDAWREERAGAMKEGNDLRKQYQDDKQRVDDHAAKLQADRQKAQERAVLAERLDRRMNPEKWAEIDRQKEAAKNDRGPRMSR